MKYRTLDLKWDTPEIYAILNGNETYWLVHPNGNKKLISKKLLELNRFQYLIDFFNNSKLGLNEKK